MFPSTLAPKMTYPGLSLWNGLSKIHYFIDFGHLSLGGCGGHPMRPKLNLKGKGQIFKPNQINVNLHISFCQDQIRKKHFALGHSVHVILNTLQCQKG